MLRSAFQSQGLSFDRFKSGFFDAAGILDAADRMTQRALSKWGAFVRTSARTSLKYGKTSSSPGSPPTVHKTIRRVKTNKKGASKVQSVSPLREFLFFAKDERFGVVVGPALFRSRARDAAQADSGTTPRVLEEGGTVTFPRRTGKGGGRYGGPFQARVAARPFMLPAAERELTNPKLRELFANQLSKHYVRRGGQ